MNQIRAPGPQVEPWRGDAAGTVDGMMVDEPVLIRARRILALAG